jgi:hypothetical protein
VCERERERDGDRERLKLKERESGVDVNVRGQVKDLNNNVLPKRDPWRENKC